MYLQHHFGLVLLLMVNEQIRCIASWESHEDEQISAPDYLPHLQYDNHENLLANDLDLKSTLKSQRITVERKNPSETASPTYSPGHPKNVATAIPSSVKKDGTMTINILFTALLLVTAILMVVTGVCLLGLRRKYIDASALKYNQLKTVKSCNCRHEKMHS